MPQVDLETLVSVCGGGGNDRKIACETLADGHHDAPEEPDIPAADADADADVPPDFPPESFWLSKDAEFDWFDRNAFLERKESTKGNSNSNPNMNPNHSNSNSQRFSINLKSKAAIIGLPKTQKTSYMVDSKRRTCKPANIRLFPKRSESVGKTTGVSVTEPSSPKVSCMGRVRSKRGRRKPSRPATETEKPVTEARTSKGQKTGLLSRLTSLLRSDGKQRKKNKPAGKINKTSEESATRKSETLNAQDVQATVEPVADPPGLGGMTRFASGRRSESWSADEIDVTSRRSFDLGRREK